MPDTEHTEDEDKRCTLFDGAKRFCQRCMEFHSEAEWADGCERYLGGQPIRQCKTCGGWHPIDMWGRNCMPEPNWNESDLPVCRQFISDNLESLGGLNGIQSMADGRFYTSKSKLRADYRARGMTEMGNDKAAPHKKPKSSKKQIRETVDRAFWLADNGAKVENMVKQRKPHEATPFGRVAGK